MICRAVGNPRNRTKTKSARVRSTQSKPVLKFLDLLKLSQFLKIRVEKKVFIRMEIRQKTRRAVPATCKFDIVSLVCSITLPGLACGKVRGRAGRVVVGNAGRFVVGKELAEMWDTIVGTMSVPCKC